MSNVREMNTVPPWWEALIWKQLRLQREQAHVTEQTILALRRMLRAGDPSLPDIYDGKAWWEIEERWAT